MGVKNPFNEKRISSYFNTTISIIKEEMINGMSYLGESCIKRIRERSPEESWIDRTGNLRTSIGYSVSDHGKSVIESAFEQVLNGLEGAREGKKLLSELLPLYRDTYALIVVAGMDYAERVEAIENKDVLASTKLWAESKLDSHIKRISERITRRIKKLKL